MSAPGLRPDRRRPRLFPHAACAAALLGLLAGCGSDKGAGPSGATLVGTVTDAAGDNQPHAGFATTPDLVRVQVRVVNGMARFTADLAAGTLTSDVEVSFALDTDQDSTTGPPSHAYDGLGPEYFLSLGPNHGVELVAYHGGSFTSIPVTASLVESATRLEVEFPLALLGGDDGRLNFKTASALSLGGGAFTGILDFAPEDAMPPVVVQ